MAKISDQAYEELRLILEKQYGQTFTIEEVREIGDGLLDFYAFLMKVGGEDEVND
jgi:hypothetical protein